MEVRTPTFQIEQIEQAQAQRNRGADMRHVARQSRTSAKAMVTDAASMRRTARAAVVRARQYLSGVGVMQGSLEDTPGRTTSERA